MGSAILILWTFFTLVLPIDALFLQNVFTRKYLYVRFNKVFTRSVFTTMFCTFRYIGTRYHTFLLIGLVEIDF